MLTCYGHTVRLPQDDLAYLAFRLALQETLSDIELHLDLDEEPDPPVGYLTEVLDRQPFEGTSWAAKSGRCASDETLWEDDGRTEIRRLRWALIVDRTGS